MDSSMDMNGHGPVERKSRFSNCHQKISRLDSSATNRGRWRREFVNQSFRHAFILPRRLAK